MTESSQQLQLLLISALAAAITIGSLGYILWAQPESLRMTRDGVPYFTPAVIHPDSGEAIPMEVLVEHYKGGG
jgi:hypothetical protein